MFIVGLRGAVSTSDITSGVFGAHGQPVCCLLIQSGSLQHLLPNECWRHLKTAAVGVHTGCRDIAKGTKTERTSREEKHWKDRNVLNYSQGERLLVRSCDISANPQTSTLHRLRRRHRKLQKSISQHLNRRFWCPFCGCRTSVKHPRRVQQKRSV